MRKVLVGILCAVTILLYIFNYNHVFLFDSVKLIKDNPHIRSLSNIPNYFINTSLYSSDGSVQGYQPVTLTTYAVNYLVSGTDMPLWHVTQVILHLGVVLGVYFFIKRLTQFSFPDKGRLFLSMVPFMVSFIVAVHPYSSQVVNYLNGRSTLLMGLFLFPSFTLYLKARQAEKGQWMFVGSVLLFGFAVFSNAEAMLALVVYIMLEFLLCKADKSHLPRVLSRMSGGIIEDFTRIFQRKVYLILRPFVAITVIYICIRMLVMPGYQALYIKNISLPGVIDFFYVAVSSLSSIFNIIVPINSFAVLPMFPFTAFDSNAMILFAIAAWSIVIYILKESYNKNPIYFILAVIWFILGFPIFRFIQGQEILGGINYYIPLAFFSLLWIIALSVLVSNWTIKGDKWKVVSFGLVVISISLFGAGLIVTTIKCNTRLTSSEAFWSGVNTDSAVLSLCMNQGRNYLKEKKYKKAVLLFEGVNQLVQPAVNTKLPFVLDQFNLYKSLAASHAGMGDWKKCLAYTRVCFNLDKKQTEYSMIEIILPYWDSPKKYTAGINYLMNLEKYYPEMWWIQENIQRLQRLRESKLSY
ncbi:hypothetical protein ACFL96_00110 [Thermoproteota archaeon]